jgi:SAM-dependent methyltransferase
VARMRGAIHESAARGFAVAPADYERGRPMYPFEAVRRLVRELHIKPQNTVLDLAAGTGKLTRLLAQLSTDVVAVEPVDAMRERLVETLPGVTALAGTAESIPLDDESVDAVTVGQAFHWFDGDAALAEIARVLRPGGLLALLWNRRVEDDPVNRAIDDLVDPLREDVPTHRTEAWRDAFERQTRFGPLDERVFESSQDLDADGLEARVASISFIAALEPAKRARVLERARAIAGKGAVRLPYRTEVQVCRRL